MDDSEASVPKECQGCLRSSRSHGRCEPARLMASSSSAASARRSIRPAVLEVAFPVGEPLGFRAEEREGCLAVTGVVPASPLHAELHARGVLRLVERFDIEPFSDFSAK